MEESTATDPERAVRPVDDRASFEEFYRAEISGVLAVLLVTTRSRVVAEDIAQESFLRAWRRWAEVRAHDRPDAWVRRVALNLSTSRFRRLRVERRLLPRLAGSDVEIDAGSADDTVWAAVRRLPARQRQVIALTYIEGRTADDIGGILGIAGGTVRVHLSRARAALRDELEVEP